MDDDDRYFNRQREFWKNCRRLNANRVFCGECLETDPRCFLGEQTSTLRFKDLLISQCERCRRKLAAPADQVSIDAKWKALKALGVANSRCYCGEVNPFCFEADHLDGRKFSDRVICCCINCHLKRTSRQLTEYLPDDFRPMALATTALKRVRGTIEHLELMANGLRNIEDFLHELAIRESSPHKE